MRGPKPTCPGGKRSSSRQTCSTFISIFRQNSKYIDQKDPGHLRSGSVSRFPSSGFDPRLKNGRIFVEWGAGSHTFSSPSQSLSLMALSQNMKVPAVVAFYMASALVVRRSTSSILTTRVLTAPHSTRIDGIRVSSPCYQRIGG